MIKRFAIVVLAAIVLSVTAIVTSVIVVVNGHTDSSDAPRVIRLTVEEGMPFGVVVRKLSEEGVISRPWAMRVYAKAIRADRRIHRGTYEFTPADSPAEILDRLIRGDVLTVAVTIPEGVTMWEISAAFGEVGVDSTLLLGAIADSTIRALRGIPAPTLEGYLFPDTYNVPFGSSAADVVVQMMDRFDVVFVDSFSVRAAQIEMTPHEVLTLASIIESEARVAGERPKISAVYHNRLRRGMRLEADPTVAYAMGGFRGRLLYVHLDTDSPYNTYKNQGLPPGPICSPGAASIYAALYPDEVLRAFYFVARGDGSHIFSMTLREHLAAIKTVRSGLASGNGNN